MSRARHLQVAFVLLVFTALGVIRNLSVPGEDLSSSYVGCRLLAAGAAAHLYSHDPEIFSVVRDAVWNETAERARFAPLGLLHPYVQTPLWAYSLRPLCMRTSFPAFRTIFSVLAMFCMSGTIWLVARFWTPALFHPSSIALLCVGLAASEPFRYAMFLTQTHILFVFLSVLALVLAERDRPMWGGLTLALAAAVKITPGFLVLYWLFAGRRKAAASFAGCSLMLFALTVVIGPTLTIAYMRELREVSNVLLVSFNNQSLAAWWMGSHYPPAELFDWRIYVLPTRVKVLSALLSVGTSVVGGLLDRRAGREQQPWQPFGAALAMVGATMFAPIAWTHYFLVLLVPVMLMLGARRTGWPGMGSRAGWLFAAAVLTLNLFPLAIGSVQHAQTRVSLPRSQFYAGLLAMAGMVVLDRRRGRAERRARSTGGLATGTEMLGTAAEP